MTTKFTTVADDDSGFFNLIRTITELREMLNIFNDDKYIDAQIQKIVDKYKLVESASLKHEEALKTIANADALNKDIAAKQAEANAKHSAAQNKLEAAQSLLHEANAKQTALAKAKIEFEAAQKIHLAKEDAITARENAVKQQEMVLADKHKFAITKEVNLAKWEEELNAKDAKIKAIMGV